MVWHRRGALVYRKVSIWRKITQTITLQRRLEMACATRVPGSTPMQIGMIGLGRMGGNMVRRLMKGGHQCVAFDHSASNVDKLAKEGATGSASLDQFIQQLRPP